jgi:hypothetical protein
MRQEDAGRDYGSLPRAREVDMSDYEYWSAEQFKDECERLREIVEALEAAEKAGTPVDALIVLAMESGVSNYYKPENRA